MFMSIYTVPGKTRSSMPFPFPLTALCRLWFESGCDIVGVGKDSNSSVPDSSSLSSLSLLSSHQPLSGLTENICHLKALCE